MTIETAYFIEDSRDEFFLTSILLKRAKLDCKIVHFFDFETFSDFLSYLSDNDIEKSIAILDLNLTLTDGLTGLQSIREQDRYDQLITGICTGSEDPADLLQARRVGADFFVNKPLNCSAFEAICRSVPCLSMIREADGHMRIHRETDCLQQFARAV